MKYVVIDWEDYGMFTDEFDTLEEARDKAYQVWSHMTENEQKNTKEFHIAGCEYNEESEDYADIKKIMIYTSNK